MRITAVIATVIATSALLASCQADDAGKAPEMESATVMDVDAACQTDTLHFKPYGHWKASCSKDWITLGCDDGDNGVLPVYIQQNDDDAARECVITIATDHGQTAVTVRQEQNPDNGSPIIELAKTYGLGWGYDASIDYADVSGIRGQILDKEACNLRFGDEMVRVDNFTNSKMVMESATSTQELQKKMSVGLSGKVDLLVAGAKVSSTYSKIDTEQKNRVFIWCRNALSVKQAYFDNAMDFGYPASLRRCLTSSFVEAVRRRPAKDIVRTFGTHLVISSTLGGKMDYYLTLSQDIKTSVETVITSITVKLLWFKKTSTSIDEKTWQDIKKDFKCAFSVSGGGTIGEQFSRELTTRVANGEPLTDQDLYYKWAACFEDPATARDENLAMIDFTVIPIWQIAEAIDAEKAQQLEDYITNEYLK